MSLNIVMHEFSLADGIKIACVNGPVLDETPILDVKGGAPFFTTGTTARTLRLLLGRSILMANHVRIQSYGVDTQPGLQKMNL